MPPSYDDVMDSTNGGGSLHSPPSQGADEKRPTMEAPYAHQSESSAECCNVDPNLSNIVEVLPSIQTSATGGVSGIPDFKPIVVPQTSTKLLERNVSPFARAYPVELSPVISPEEWLKFTDGLNEAFLAAPLIRLVGAAGGMVSFDPTGFVGWIGMGVQIGSGILGGVTSIARTKSFIKKVNASTFRPLGLRVAVMSTTKMMREIGIPPGVKLPPLPEFDENWSAESPQLDPRRRRLATLGNNVAELDWVVAPMQMPDNFMRKAGAWQAKMNEKGARRKHRKGLAKVKEMQDKVAEAEEKGNKELMALNNKRGKAADRLAQQGNSRKAQEDYWDKMRDIDKEEAKVKEDLAEEIRKESKNAREEGDKHVEKEQKFMQRIRWIVVTKFDWPAAEAQGVTEADYVDTGIDEREGHSGSPQ